MKTIIAFTLAALLCGCERSAPPLIMDPTLVEEFGEAQFQLLTNALASAHTKEDVLPTLAHLVDESVIQNLSHEGPKSLSEMVDEDSGLPLGCSHRQLVEAIKRHNARPHTRKVAVPKELTSGE